MAKIIYASDVRKISSDKFNREVGEVILSGKDGVKVELEKGDLKKHMQGLVQGGKTGLTVEKYLKKSGLTGYQVEKRKNILSLLRGEKGKNERPTVAMIREEKMKKRANVIGGRSIARRLEEGRSLRGDKNSRVDERLNKALVGIDEKGRKTKTGFSALNIKQKEYDVTKLGGDITKKSLTSSLESKSHLTFAGQSNDGGIASIDDRAKNATSITGGVGAIKKLNNPGLGGGMGGNKGGHIPLSKAA